jgi:hypothetical protein
MVSEVPRFTMPPTPPSTFFSTLGNRALNAWKAVDFNPSAFPSIAEATLNTLPPSKHLSPGDLFHEFLVTDQLPAQSTSGFGQPELIVFEHSRFYIQVLVWMDGSTDIHQHLFDGAFHVMHGSSIHSRFVFEEANDISAHLRTGNLRMTSTELLETGQTVPITSGTGFIHALFHLDSPSLTVVLRTHTSPGAGPQFTYLAPHLAVDPFLSDTLTLRRKQILDTLEALEDSGYCDAVSACLADLDFERGFFILQNCAETLLLQGAWARIFKAFRKKHGPKADLIPPTLAGIRERDHLVSLRSEVTDPELRFFLALKLNIPSEEERLRLIKQRFKGDPKKWVHRWEESLAELT